MKAALLAAAAWGAVSVGAQECTKNLQCRQQFSEATPPLLYCFGAGTCVECKWNSHCRTGDAPWSTPFCVNNQCVADCTKNGQCKQLDSSLPEELKQGALYCQAGDCVECKRDQHCPAGTTCEANVCVGGSSGGNSRPLEWPVVLSPGSIIPPIVGTLGPRRMEDGGYRWHMGMDLDLAPGVNVNAPADGEVTTVANSVAILHENLEGALLNGGAVIPKTFTMFHCLVDKQVMVEAAVAKGDLLGRASDCSGFPHAHIGTRTQEGIQHPMRFLPANPEGGGTIALEASVGSNGDGVNVMVVASVPRDKLTLNVIEIAFVDGPGGGNPECDSTDDCVLDFEVVARQSRTDRDKDVQGLIRIDPDPFYADAEGNYPARKRVTFTFEGRLVPDLRTHVKVTASTVLGTSETVIVPV